jgi:hypothetical protein
MSGITGHIGLLLNGAWTPSQLAVSPYLWYDDSTAVTNVSGAASTWADKQSTALDLQQTTAGNRPTINAVDLNGLRTLTFNGTSQFMLTNSTNGRAFSQNASNNWALAVVKKTNVDGAGTPRPLLSSNADTGPVVRFQMGVGASAGANKGILAARRLGADASGVLAGSTSVGSGWQIVIVTMNYATRAGQVWLNGVSDGSSATLTAATGTTANSPASEQLSVGASVTTSNVATAWGDVTLAAVLGGLNGLPSTLERQKLEGWAAWRYGLTANLDVTHPYKSVPPT